MTVDTSMYQSIPAPNPTGNLAQLMGIANAANQYRIGQSEAQQAQQQMAERQTLQSMLASGQAPDGTAIKGSDGEIDPVAFGKAANTYLPLTGQQVQQNIIQTLNNRVQLNDSIRGLGQQYRNDISGIVRSGIGTNGSGMSAALNAYAQKNPGAAESIMRAQALTASMSPQMPQMQRDSALMHLAMEFQPAQETAGQQTPSEAGYTAASGGLGMYQTNPLSPVPMGPNGPQAAQGISPAERTAVGINPATGQPYEVLRSPSGVGASAQPLGGQSGMAPQAQAGTQAPGAPASGWPTLGEFPTPQQVQSASAAAQEADAVRTADSSPTTGYAATRQVYSNLLNLVSQNPAIGPQSQEWNQITGALTPWGAKGNANMQEVGSYLDRLAMQNANNAGMGTDAGRALAAGATGSTNLTPQALAEKLRFGAATLEAQHAYRQGLDATMGTANQNPIAKRAFDAAWSQNADLNAFRAMAAHNMNDQAGFNSTMSQINALPAAQWKAVQQHIQNLQMLMHGKMPPQ